jgi:carbamate kinase
MATDVEGVYRDWGSPAQQRIDWIAPEELAKMAFAAGSMGPKVEAAVEFATATGKRAVIGSLDQIDGLVAGTAGTNVSRETQP